MADGADELMTMFEAESHSFVLRLWLEHDGAVAAPGEWRGWLDHVQTGRRYYFRELTAIERIVADCLDRVEDPADQLFEPMRAPKQEDE